MYIRRKVFSALTNEMGEERLFSTTDYVLDQYEFSSKRQKLLREKYEQSVAGKGVSAAQAKKIARKMAMEQEGSNLNYLVNHGGAGTNGIAGETGKSIKNLKKLGGDVKGSLKDLKEFLKKGYDKSYTYNNPTTKDISRKAAVAKEGFFKKGVGSLKNLYAKHPTASKVAAGTAISAGLAGLGYEGYKHYKNRENEQD